MDILKPSTLHNYGNTSPAKFHFLVVDDFGVKYIDKADDHHLIDALKNTMKYLKTGQGDYTAPSH